ncbi:RDD family protein [Streptomyces sp. DSM 44915]|uniref:RDD family protein n=1 Tax=Streptomyces chisholmiae TaxID=3075540 RepID=A0ABU2JSA5_9ACTN|nr:RDD family protein [Streptomyces sp. DSM 44915]MDT0267873.1 RDD family protein [Streptomyces sp. DSM 44915]
MSTEQPQPGPGGEPERNRPPDAEPGRHRPVDPANSRDPGLPPAPPPPAAGDTTGVAGVGGADRYGSNPYGGPQGAADPLAGMPPLAPLGRRLLARIIDMLVVGIPMTLLLWPIIGAYDFDDGGGGEGYLRQAVIILVYFVYEGLMLSARGQTLGKMAMRIRVAMLADGSVPQGRPGWLRAAVYSLPQLVSCVGFVFWLVNVLFCTWDQPYRQCLHDKAARTVVVTAR